MFLNAEKFALPVKEVLQYYLDSIEQEKITAITSVAIIGSAALNDFYPNKSDIDFMASVSRKLTGEEVAKLDAIHKEIKNKFNIDLDGFYLEERLLSKPEQDDITCHVCFNTRVYAGTRPALYTMPYFLLQNASVFIYGHKPVIQSDFKAYMTQLHNYMNTTWASWIKDVTFPGKKMHLLLFYPRYVEWSVLQSAKCLHVLKTGTMVSKKQAGLYLLQNYPAQYHNIIKEAIALLPVGKKKIQFSIARYRKTISILKTIVNSFNEEFEQQQTPDQ